jgi:heme-degrading monooxygenase HmoA
MTDPEKPPYYAVIFRSRRTKEETGYADTAARMEQLARQQPGFLGVASFRSPDGTGVTISYWESLDAVRDWKQFPEHQTAQQLGKEQWYAEYTVEIAKIESVYHFPPA